MSRKIVGIYKITSPTKRVYVGQSIDVFHRMNYHKQMYSKDSSKLYLSFNKHGVDSHVFEVIEECSVELLNERERYWQEYYDVLNKGLNCVLTKTNDKSGYHSEQTKINISKGLKGRKLSKEHIEKMRVISSGRVFSKESIEKRMLKVRGRKITESQRTFLKESRLGVNNPMFGKHHSKESISKISNGLKGSKNYLYKPLFNPYTGIYYDTLEEASLSINWDRRKLWAHINIYVLNKSPFIYA